jgi:thiol-disulfide isomerase/thioredoxin/outer membrane lipoprotein-sorting protein
MLKKRMVCFLVLAASITAWADPTTQPDVTSVPTTQPTVDTVLAGMGAAYAGLASAQFNGEITGKFDINGQVNNLDQKFTSSFTAPNKFRHESTDEMLLGSTGKTVYAYLNGRDEYQSSEAPRTRVASADWPPVVQVLAEQNPSLLLAISKSAVDELKELSKNITLEPATTIGGIAYDTLKFDVGDDHDSLTLLVDPTTHLLRRMITDRKNSSIKAGAVDVKCATITVDYTAVLPDVAVDAAQFAWSAPAGAVQVSATPTAMASAASDGDHKALVGKTAPDFTLHDLDDQSVTLSKLKGSVVVLDFWATWCGPCVMSLPHLDQLYKEQSPNGLKVYALDQQEDQAKVAEFVKSKGWSLPVLLDSDGAVAAKYKVTGIPQTVVVGKDGKIKQIFVGSGHEKEIAAIVAKEMGG